MHLTNIFNDIKAQETFKNVFGVQFKKCSRIILNHDDGSYAKVDLTCELETGETFLLEEIYKAQTNLTDFCSLKYDSKELRFDRYADAENALVEIAKQK